MNSTLIWTMLIGSPNDFTNWLQNFKVLRLFGKYSFGTYLLQGVAQIVYSQRFYFDRIIAVFSMSLVCGFLFYHIVEKNSIKTAVWITKKLNL